MKTRIIQTRFWDDDIVQSLSKDANHLWIFLLTNKEIGMTNYVKIPDVFIMHYTKMTAKELELAKKELQSTGKIFFLKDWIFIKNLERENKYKNSPKLQKPYEEELSHIPKEVIAGFDNLLSKDSSIDSSISSSTDTPINSKTKTHKSKIINQKGEILEKWKVELKEIVDYFNEIFETNIKSTKGFEKNYQEWRGVHDVEKIKQAIFNARQNKFWKDKMTLAVLFRTKNPNGEAVDRIEDLFNQNQTQRGGIAII